MLISPEATECSGLYLENTGARSLTYAIAGALVDGRDVNLRVEPENAAVFQKTQYRIRRSE